MLYQIVFFIIHSFNKPVLWRDYIGFSRNMELLHTKPSFQPSHHLLKLSVPNLRFKCCIENLGIQRTTTCRYSIWIGKSCYHPTYGSHLLTSIQCSYSSSSELGDVNCTLPVHSLVVVVQVIAAEAFTAMLRDESIWKEVSTHSDMEV